MFTGTISPMTDSMIERVASAIARSARAVGGGYVSGDEFPWEDAARAAIAAMREPTEAMVAEARRNNHPRDEETWRTMIDAALK